MKCEICKKEITGFTNNASPLMDGECCSECNSKHVVPLRIFLAGCIKDSVLILKPDNEFEIRPIEKEIKLKEMQSIVEGWVEQVPKRSEHFYFLVNEEGLMRALKANELAYRLFGLKVVGNMIVCPKNILV